MRMLPYRTNLREVSKTTLPLLSTVLAGFTITITLQFINRLSNIVVFIAAIFLSVSIILFLTSTIYAIWAQSYDYGAMLTPDMRDILKIKDEELDNYMGRVFRYWQFWHKATFYTFLIGVMALLISVILITWSLLSWILAVLGLIMLAMVILFSIYLKNRIDVIVRKYP
jgi:hypothetical protein